MIDSYYVMMNRILLILRSCPFPPPFFPNNLLLQKEEDLVGKESVKQPKEETHW